MTYWSLLGEDKLESRHVFGWLENWIGELIYYYPETMRFICIILKCDLKYYLEHSTLWSRCFAYMAYFLL